MRKICVLVINGFFKELVVDGFAWTIFIRCFSEEIEMGF